MSNKPSLPQEVFLLPPDFLSRGPQHQGTRARHESKVKVERPLLERGRTCHTGAPREKTTVLSNPKATLNHQVVLSVGTAF